ncbi:MAG: DNA repair protein RecN [Rhodobacteraceae bacterium]|nr:DNA repair protein RecN [Paracoccaceae bacterium]
MLVSLTIRDMLLIKQVDLRFGAGLNVLTGETGAGKSILLDSLGFVLGRRGRAGMVRAGAALGEVSAVFELDQAHPVAAILDQAGLPFDGELLLRRLNYPDGRKRAFVNDRAVSAEVLRGLGAALVEVHGQHDDRGLLNARGHMALLDSFAENERALVKVAAAWAGLRQAEAELEAAQQAVAAAEADAEYVRHALEELAVLAPETGEDATLDSQRRLMQGAERVREDVGKAVQAREMAEGLLHDALRWMQDADDVPGLGLADSIEAMGRVLTELNEVQTGVESALQRLDVDPFELEQIEERLFAIRALARKHNVLPDELPALWQGFAQKVKDIDSSGSRIAALSAQRAQAAGLYNTAADALRERRLQAARRLDRLMRAELAPLKMENAGFETVVAEATAGVHGKDTVFFQVSTNPGAPAGAIEKIASGGELSRFLLALKVCLTTRSSGLTMIFDEIDRGVGGATADAVGRRLAAVAEGAQVLVVTHSPQVAAMGQVHFVVSKSMEKGATRTDVCALSGAGRLDEIARMLAGDVISDAARAAAQALLDNAPVAAR